MNRKKIEARLERMARTEAPDGWLRLRARALEAMPERSPERTVPMEGRKRPRPWIYALSGVAAVALVVSLSLALLLQGAAPPVFTPGGEVKVKGGTLFFNGVTASNLKIGMPPDAEIVDLVREDLPALFGRDPIPALPEGFVSDADTISAMLFSNGTVFLMNGVAFSTDPKDPLAPRVFFDLNDKGELPLLDCRFTSESPSTLNGVEVMVGMQTFDDNDGNGPYDVYDATFVAGGVGYRIRTVRVSAEDFLSILSAAVKG